MHIELVLQLPGSAYSCGSGYFVPGPNSIA